MSLTVKEVTLWLLKLREQLSILIQICIKHCGLKQLKQDLRKIITKIGGLADEPCPQGCEKLTGQEKYRLRQGCYRIVYSIQDKEVTVWVVKVDKLVKT